MVKLSRDTRTLPRSRPEPQRGAMHAAIPGTYLTSSTCTLLHPIMNSILVKDMFMASVRETQSHREFDLVAYIIFDDTFHLIVRTFKDKTPLPLIMKEIKYRFTRKYNALSGNIGTTWSRKYSKIRIDDSADPSGYFKWIVARLFSSRPEGNASKNDEVRSFCSFGSFFRKGFIPELKLAEHEFFLAAGATEQERMREFRRFAEIYRETKFLDG